MLQVFAVLFPCGAPCSGAGRVSGLLSGQTPVSSTVPKIAQVRTGQHKEVLFGSPVPFQNNIKEWLCPSLKRYIKSKKTQQLPVLYKQKGWAGNTGSLYYILGNKKKICCCYAETCRQDLWASEAHSYLQIVFLNSNQTVSDVVAYINAGTQMTRYLLELFIYLKWFIIAFN